MTPDNLEDVTWMAHGGESLTGAARRLGVAPSTIERWLQRHDMERILDKLRHREPWPVDANRRLGRMYAEEERFARWQGVP